MNFPHTVYTAGKPDQDTKTCLFPWPPLCPELTTQIVCQSRGISPWREIPPFACVI